MTVLREAKLKLAKMLKIKLGEIDSSKGKLYFDGDEYSVGTEVYAMDEAGEYVMPENGDYEDGEKTIVVADGVITDIKEASAAGDGDGDGDGKADPKEVEAVAEIVSDLIDELQELKNEVLELKEQHKTYTSANEAVKKELKETALKLEEALKGSNGKVVEQKKTLEGVAGNASALEKFHAQRK